MLKLGIKKPKQDRSKGTVDAILEAVTHIIDKDGPLGLTTNKIAEKAGVSVGSLYQYFKNKESIIEAILLRLTENNLNGFEQQFSQKPEAVSIRSIIHIIVQTQFDSIQSMGKLSSVLFEYAPQVLSPSHFKNSDERIIKFLTDKTNEFKIELRPGNIENAFFVCSQSVRSVMFMTILSRPSEERQAIIDELVDMLTIYLEKK
jgi:AcrR family transcriptional regulator